jgi:hypothetical protein
MRAPQRLARPEDTGLAAISQEVGKLALATWQERNATASPTGRDAGSRRTSALSRGRLTILGAKEKPWSKGTPQNSGE